jgi:hypothetical protein
VLACYACNHRRGVLDTTFFHREEHIERSGGCPKLHEQPYQERKRRLEGLRRRVEYGIAGLVSVMGEPVANSGWFATQLRGARKAARE